MNQPPHDRANCAFCKRMDQKKRYGAAFYSLWAVAFLLIVFFSLVWFKKVPHPNQWIKNAWTLDEGNRDR